MILVIGVGNPLRGDDGAGPLLAHALAKELRAMGVGAIVRETQQLVPELAVEMTGETVGAVVICDARVNAGESGLCLQRLEEAGRAARQESAPFTHEITPGTLLGYAHSLNERAYPPLACWLLTAPARNFELGEDLSDATHAALSGARAAAHNLLLELSAG